METQETLSVSHELLLEYQYMREKHRLNQRLLTIAIYRFCGFWVSEFQETWKLVKTSKNSESILTFC